MVRQIPRQNQSHFQQSSHCKYPTSIDTICPSCKRLVNFNINWHTPYTGVVDFGRVYCPGCKDLITFTIIFENSSGINKMGEVYIFPGASTKEVLPEMYDLTSMSDSVKKSYVSAVNVFNTKEWTATAVLCRRTLEGIAKSLLNEETRKKSLFEQIKALPTQVNLAEPILLLADQLRKGGNLGAHFDEEKELNEDVCDIMIDTLNYLIEYLFIVPERIKKLQNKLDNL